MIAFIGLGNIGDQYADTKHNAGFWVMDEVAQRQRLSFNPGFHVEINLKFDIHE